MHRLPPSPRHVSALYRRIFRCLQRLCSGRPHDLAVKWWSECLKVRHARSLPDSGSPGFRDTPTPTHTLAVKFAMPTLIGVRRTNLKGNNADNNLWSHSLERVRAQCQCAFARNTDVFVANVLRTLPTGSCQQALTRRAHGPEGTARTNTQNTGGSLYPTPSSERLTERLSKKNIPLRQQEHSPTDTHQIVSGTKFHKHTQT